MSEQPTPAANDCVKIIADRNIYFEKSIQISVINWWHVFCTQYLPKLFWAIIAVLCGFFFHSLVEAGLTLDDVVGVYQKTQTNVLNLGWQGALLVISIIMYLAYMRPSVYLLGFSCFDAPEDWKVDHAGILKIFKEQGSFTEESLIFMEKLIARGGTGASTAWSPNLVASLRNGGRCDDSIDMARLEFEQVVFPCVEDVLKKTKLKPKQIDFLIINCSLFSPTPSLCSMVALKFGLRADCRSFNLSGMGCSASVISVDLAKSLLAAHPNSTALVISTENISRCLYRGQDRAMLLQNSLFRCGAAAMVLSNKMGDANRALYKLLYTVRTQRINEDSYEAVFECQDSEGNQGIRLSKDIVKVAGKALTANLTTLAPLILPVRELVKSIAYIVAAKAFPSLRKMLSSNGFPALAARIPEKVPSYVPDFTRSIDHFCVHAGGRAVIDGIEQNLRLQPHLLEASRKTLHDFGNTSSSSIWYELRFLEGSGNMKQGDRVLQIAFGSGFKCNSAVWLRLRK